MAPRMNDLVPMLVCQDVQASIKFYCDVLGFEVVERMDDVGVSGWASIKNHKTHLMLASPTYLPRAKKTEGRFPQAVFYFYPDDVVQLHKSVRTKGYEISDLVVRFYGMKEFEMLDLDGHVLTFGQKTEDSPTPEIGEMV